MSVSLEPHGSFLLRPAASSASRQAPGVHVENVWDEPAIARHTDGWGETFSPDRNTLKEARTPCVEPLQSVSNTTFKQPREERYARWLLPSRSSEPSTPFAESDTQEGSTRFVNRRSVSSSSGSSSFERSVVLKEKRRAESVSSESDDGSSDHEWSKGTPSNVRRKHIPEECEDSSSDPNVSSTPFASDPRHYRLPVKKRRRRRKNCPPGEKTLFGPFKFPEEAPVLTGFKEPRTRAASGTPLSPETPVYLYKDGFDGTECVPGGKSVFIPRNRHRDIAGLSALSFRDAPLRPPRKAAAPMPLKSHLSDTSRSFEDDVEVGLFGGGSGSKVDPGRPGPGPVAPGDANASQHMQKAEEMAAAGAEHGLFSELDRMEQEARGSVVRQTPEVRGYSPHTPPCDGSAPIPETPTRDRSFDIFSPFVITRGADGLRIEALLGGPKRWDAQHFPRRKTTSGARNYQSQRNTDSVFVPRKRSRRALSSGFPGARECSL